MTNSSSPIFKGQRPLTFESREPFLLECGAMLPTLRIAYETWGEPNARGDNAILVVHALTGDAHAASGSSGGEARPGWWEGLIGDGRALDPRRHFIICANLVGSCYGSSGPADPDPSGGWPLGPDFPVVTTRDMARAQRALLDGLGVTSLDLVLGGSLGAMVVWEFVVEYPGFARRAAPIAGGPEASPWVVALNSVARQAVEGDADWCGGHYEGSGPVRGLALARQIAMISYRTAALFRERFGRARAETGPEWELACGNPFQVEKYLAHQGRKLAARFDARAYVALTRAMDLHDIGRGRGGVGSALAGIESEVLCVGIDTDVLFDPREMEEAARATGRAGGEGTYREIASPYGHDAFLVEYGQLEGLLRPLLEGRRA